jgi:ATP-dependent Clp protease ATP-binding subunit ClpC
MPQVIESMELAQVLAEAADIAASVNQKLTSAHHLLAFFTVPNRAEILLRERGVDEDRILATMTGKPKEPEGVERDLRERAREIAASVGSGEVDCLHLLIAMSRVRASVAHQLLGACGIQLATLRNVALSYFTARMPRRLKEVQPVKVGPAAAAPPSARRTAPPPASADEAAASADALRELDAQLEKAMEELQSDAGIDGATPTPSPTQTSTATATPSATATPARARRSAYALDPKEFPWLSQLGRNLTDLAAAGKLDPLVGREREVEEAIDVLGKRRTNNPLLVGEPGVGKTAIVEGIAQKLLGGPSRDEISTRGGAALTSRGPLGGEISTRGGAALASGGPLGGRVIVEIDMASVLAGTQLRGAFSEKLLGIKNEVRRADGRVIVFIDEIHTIMGAGATGDGPQDAANELKSALSRGEFPCIGATTHDEYRQHIEKDPALERRFTPVLVREPSIPDTVTILQGLAPRYAKHHGVRYRPEALEAAAALSARHVTDRFLPDKAVAVLDLAGSRARRAGAGEVAAADVARVVAKMAGIPESRLLASDQERILALDAALAERVVGHADGIARIARVLKRNFAGFSSRRPMGSFLFVGPTGVGKTELARALADALYGSREALVQLDMSECAEQTGVARLVGAAPGYVGYGEGGQLTDPVRRRPASVVVLDEIEKAHRDVQMLLLQVLEEGRLTDGRGRQVDFSNAVVVLTSNLGGAEATRTSSGAMGFGARERSAPREDRVLEAARAAVPPELWNRLDDRIAFAPLSREDVARIARLLLAESSRRLEGERRIRFAASDEAVLHLLDHGGWDPSLGARPMRSAVQRLVEAPLAERILRGEMSPGDEVLVEAEEGALRFRRAARA